MVALTELSDETKERLEKLYESEIQMLLDFVDIRGGSDGVMQLLHANKTLTTACMMDDMIRSKANKYGRVESEFIDKFWMRNHEYFIEETVRKCEITDEQEFD